MAVPLLVRTNIRSLFWKWQTCFKCWIHTSIVIRLLFASVNLGWMLTWMTLSCLRFWSLLTEHKTNRIYQKELSQANSSGCGKSEVVFSHSWSAVECLTIPCDARFCFLASMLPVIFISLSTFQSEISLLLFNPFTPFILPANISLFRRSLDMVCWFPLIYYFSNSVKHFTFNL